MNIATTVTDRNLANQVTTSPIKNLPNKVMFNAYPDSVGGRLSDIVELLKHPEFADTIGLFYILPTFFNSDLDRGFSIIDYGLNSELVSPDDLAELSRLGIGFKFDLVLNHLSVQSPQFQDLLARGTASEYRDFFIDWNEFWNGYGQIGGEGYVVPQPEYFDKLFRRKPGAPILKVRFPDGSDRPYWNTFYQEINYRPMNTADLAGIDGLDLPDRAGRVAALVNQAIQSAVPPEDMDLGEFSAQRRQIIEVVESCRAYKGQMDLNARSEKVWAFYDETLKQLASYGAKIIRLDAFAYLHKVPGESNFFNRPGTWEYLERLRGIANRYGLIVFPEIHAEYGSGLHEEVASEGFPIYDFFFPGLVIDALERGEAAHLLHWIDEIQRNGLKTINMLGCHDGIPVLDLGGKRVEGQYREGLLGQAEIEAVMETIIARGGRVKNLYGSDGKKIAYYQVNATFFSALGEDERKLLLARAIQMFMPGIPQVWYLDLFAGCNDYAAADLGGTGGHKEINRTNLSLADIAVGLQRNVVRDQLALMRLRNTAPAFAGELTADAPASHVLRLAWRNGNDVTTLTANLHDHSFVIEQNGCTDRQTVLPHVNTAEALT